MPPVSDPVLKRRLSEVLDRDVGVLVDLSEVRPEAGHPSFFHFKGRSADTGQFCRQSNFRDSGGASITRDQAMLKAAGEAIERYCAAIYEVEDFTLQPWRNLGLSAVHPSEFVLYSERQYASNEFPWEPFDEDTPVRWTPAVDMRNGTSVLIPACRVYCPYNYYLGTDDTPIDQPISTGLACHESFEQAALSGLCEVVERDAVMLTWQAMICPPQILIESLPDDLYDLVRRFEVVGDQVTLLNITTDNNIPTVLASSRTLTGRGPALVVAAASSLDPHTAAWKALEELAHTRRYCQWVKSNAPRLIATSPEFPEVHDQLTHLNFHVDQANLHCSKFLFASDARLDFDELGQPTLGAHTDQLRELCSRIEVSGHRPLVVDVTTEDVRSLGLHVVRGVVPGYQPLHMGFRLRSLGGARLQEALRHRHSRIDLADGDNPSPHPYP